MGAFKHVMFLLIYVSTLMVLALGHEPIHGNESETPINVMQSGRDGDSRIYETDHKNVGVQETLSNKIYTNLHTEEPLSGVSEPEAQHVMTAEVPEEIFTGQQAQEGWLTINVELSEEIVTSESLFIERSEGDLLLHVAKNATSASTHPPPNSTNSSWSGRLSPLASTSTSLCSNLIPNTCSIFIVNRQLAAADMRINYIIDCDSYQSSSHQCFFNMITITMQQNTQPVQEKIMLDSRWKNGLHIKVTGPGHVLITPDCSNDITMKCVLINKSEFSGLGGTCSIYFPCYPEHSVCDNGVCDCDDGYMMYNQGCLSIRSVILKISVFIVTIIIFSFVFLLLWIVMKRRQRRLTNEISERRTSVDSIETYVRSRMSDRPPCYEDVEDKPPAYEDAVATLNVESAANTPVSRIGPNCLQSGETENISNQEHSRVCGDNRLAMLLSSFGISGRRIFLRSTQTGQRRHGIANLRFTMDNHNEEQQRQTVSR